MLSFRTKNSAIYSCVVLRNHCYSHVNTAGVVACSEAVWFSPRRNPERSGRLLVCCLTLGLVCAYPLTLRLGKKEKGMGAVEELVVLGGFRSSVYASFPVREGSVNLNRGFGIHMDQFCFLSWLTAPSKESKPCTLLLVLRKSSVGWKNLWNNILVPCWHCE